MASCSHVAACFIPPHSIVVPQHLRIQFHLLVSGRRGVPQPKSSSHLPLRQRPAKLHRHNRLLPMLHVTAGRLFGTDPRQLRCLQQQHIVSIGHPYCTAVWTTKHEHKHVSEARLPIEAAHRLFSTIEHNYITAVSAFSLAPFTALSTLFDGEVQFAFIAVQFLEQQLDCLYPSQCVLRQSTADLSVCWILSLRHELIAFTSELGGNALTFLSQAVFAPLQQLGILCADC